jgi:RNase H-fold protein (predicted Holliday junction resolvase)
LQTKLALPIHLVDETLSSQEVAERLEAAAASLKKRQGPIDHYAAALILEEFLDAVLH